MKTSQLTTEYAQLTDLGHTHDSAIEWLEAIHELSTSEVDKLARAVASYDDDATEWMIQS